MAKKKKNKVDYLKLLVNTFFSIGFLTIIFASSWWSGLKEDDKIKIKISDTNILNDKVVGLVMCWISIFEFVCVYIAIY